MFIQFRALTGCFYRDLHLVDWSHGAPSLIGLTDFEVSCFKYLWDTVDETIQARFSPCSYYCPFSMFLFRRFTLHLYPFPLTSVMPRLTYNYYPALVSISERFQISFGAALLLSSLALGCQYIPTYQLLMKSVGRVL